MRSPRGAFGRSRQAKRQPPSANTEIDCIYSLFQAYDPRLWGPPSPTVAHDVWSLLRRLLEERRRGHLDVPIVRHWGFDVHNLDPDVTDALDGHIFCNREKLAYWTRPRGEGGRALEIFGDPSHHVFLDGDLPKLEFMNEQFTEPLSETDGEIHTVCVGRPFNVDFLAAARRGIHVHVYSNDVDDVYRAIAGSLSVRAARRSRALLDRYLHVHEPLQPVGTGWREVRETKGRWVQEFSRYDAAWSYIGTPFAWDPLDDRAAIPNRLGTYLLAGLPVISDRRPGFYRYDELRRLGVQVELVDSDYDSLGRGWRTRSQLASAATTPARPAAGTPSTRPSSRCWARSRGRVSGTSRSPMRPARASTPPGRAASSTSTPAGAGSVHRGLTGAGCSLRLARVRSPGPSNRADDKRGAGALFRLVAKVRAERRHRRRVGSAGIRTDPLGLARALPGGVTGWLGGRIPRGERRRVLRACLATGGARLGALLRAPDLWHRAGRRKPVGSPSSRPRTSGSPTSWQSGSVAVRMSSWRGERSTSASSPSSCWRSCPTRTGCTARDGSSSRSRARTRPRLYYFSPHHEERPGRRRYVPITDYPVGRGRSLRYDTHHFPARLDTARWAPPPYKERFRSERFGFDRELCVVVNKTSSELYLRRGFAVNSMDAELALEVVDRLRARYQVVYCRPQASDIVPDHQRIRDPGDVEGANQYPDVLTIHSCTPPTAT